MTERSPWRVSRPRLPKPGESLNGFIARVAAAEGLPNTLELTALAGATWSTRPELSRGGRDMSDLAACLRMDARQLEAMAYPKDYDLPMRRLFRSVSIDKRLIVHNERRFSPTTLDATGVHMAEWQLRPFPFCRASWEFLGSRCPDPDCAVSQRWYYAAGVELCDICGEPLARANRETVAVEHRGSLEAALDLLHPCREQRATSITLLPLQLRDISPGDLLDLLVALAIFHKPAIRSVANNRIFGNGTAPAVLNEAIASAWRTMTRWPGSFEAIAADRISTRTASFGDGNRGATMRFLDNAIDEAAPRGLASIVANLRRSLSARDRGIGSAPAGLLPSVKSTELVALRRQRVLTTIFTIDGNRPQPYLDRKEVAALSDALSSSVPINFAASALGIADNGVEQLQGLGFLDVEALMGTVDMEGAHRITTSSLNILKKKLVVAAIADDPDWVRLSTVLRLIGGRQKPWGPIIDLMLNRLIRYTIGSGHQSIMRRVRIAPHDVIKVVESYYVAPKGTTFLSNMSRCDAMDVLNLHKRHSVEALATWPSTNSATRTVPVESLLAMSRQVISLGEIAARTGLPGVSVSALLRKNSLWNGGLWASRAETEAVIFGHQIFYSAMNRFDDTPITLKLFPNSKAA